MTFRIAFCWANGSHASTALAAAALAMALVTTAAPHDGGRRVERAQHRLEHLELVRVCSLRVAQRNHVSEGSEPTDPRQPLCAA